jgi:hypothetical protein
MIIDTTVGAVIRGIVGRVIGDRRNALMGVGR